MEALTDLATFLPDATEDTSVERFFDAPFDEDEIELIKMRFKEKPSHSAVGIDKVSYRQILENILIKRGVVGIRHLEFGTLEAIYGAVSAGIGVTLLPKSLIGGIWHDRSVAVYEIVEAESRITTVFVHRDDALISSALKEFLKFARPTPVKMQAAE